MKLKQIVAMMLVAASPLFMAPASIDGSLGNFSQGTGGGQNASSWGLPQGDGGQNSSQGSGQSSGQGSGQSATQSSSQSTQSSSQSTQNSTQDSSGNTSTTQEPKGEPNESTDGSTQDPKGEPNESNDGSTQDPKGEPNMADSSSRGGSRSGGSGGSRSGGGTSGGDYPPLDPSDGQYDPTNTNDDNQIPSGCAEAGSQCAQCVRDAEANIQFNRRYLHTAWSITNSTIDYANKKIAFGDSVSSIHGAMGLSWQLAGKPQIEEAVADLRKTYGKKYRDYTGHIERSLRKMADCEQNNFATRDLYQRFGFLYMEFIRSRYESPD